MSIEISISGHNQAWIRRKMASGGYATANEVISVALDLLERLDPDVEREWADMRESVRQGKAESDAGLGIPGDEVFDEFRRRNVEMVREKRG